MKFGSILLSISFLLGNETCLAQSGWINPSQMQPANLFADLREIDPDIYGVWQSEGYGWILSIDAEKVELFDVTATSCINAQDTLEEYESYFHNYALDSMENRLGLRGKFEDYTYYFSRINAKPAQCSKIPVSTPQTNFKYFTDVMAKHYAFFGVRGVDWGAVVAEKAPHINQNTTDEELWAIFMDMLQPIDDGHVTLSRLVDGRRQTFMPGRGRTQNSIIPLAKSKGTTPGRLFGEWYEEYKASILSDLLFDEGAIIARDRVIYGMIDEEIGYLNVLKMGGYIEGLGWSIADFQAETDALNDALDEAFEHMSSAKGIVVDATYNGGGFDYLGREIAARFTGEPILGSHRSPANVSSVSPQPLYTYPTGRKSFDGPVVVLSSNLTMSASESFVMHMKAMPHVDHMGEPTRGALSEVLSKTLPNGWSVSISNENYLDGQMRSWEGKGVQPEIQLQVFDPENIFEGHLEAVQEAVQHLKIKITKASVN